MAFLELQDVGKSYGTKKVLSGLTLDIERHAVICLIGASGSGKSTLLRCINALEVIDDGQILLEGAVVSGRGVALNQLRQRIGIVFQSYNLFLNLTVLENIMLGPIRAKRVPKRVASDQGRELLKRVGLEDRAEAYPDQLSGGQQQRVAIVRALGMQPDLLLLDEVTSALDPELVGEVLDMIRDLASTGMTMVLATHEMNFAREVASRICFLHEGAVLEEGPPESLLSNPVRSPTRAFLRRVKA